MNHQHEIYIQIASGGFLKLTETQLKDLMEAKKDAFIVMSKKFPGRFYVMDYVAVKTSDKDIYKIVPTELSDYLVKDYH